MALGNSVAVIHDALKRTLPGPRSWVRGVSDQMHDRRAARKHASTMPPAASLRMRSIVLCSKVSLPLGHAAAFRRSKQGIFNRPHRRTLVGRRLTIAKGVKLPSHGATKL